MLKTWPKTSSSTSIALQMDNLMPRISCLRTLWTLKWVLHFSHRPQLSQWIPISSSQDTLISNLKKLLLMIMSSKRVLWLTTRPLIHIEIKALLIWSQGAKETPRTLRPGLERDQLRTRLVKDWKPLIFSTRQWHKLSKEKTESCSLSLTSESWQINQLNSDQCTLLLKQALTSLKLLKSRRTNSTLILRINLLKCKPHSWRLQPKCQTLRLSIQTWHLTSTTRRSSRPLKSILVLTMATTWAWCKGVFHSKTRWHQPTLMKSLQCLRWTLVCLSITSTILNQTPSHIWITFSSIVRLLDRDCHLKTNSQLTLWWRWIKMHL